MIDQQEGIKAEASGKDLGTLFSLPALRGAVRRQQVSLGIYQDIACRYVLSSTIQ